MNSSDSDETAGTGRVTPLALLGPSEAARRARSAFSDALDRRQPVLIVAEPGCRPLEIARALHEASRPAEPFVVLPSGSDPVELAERILGPASPGSSDTGLEAVGDQAALLAAASGTLFLEDVDDLPASAQRRLSRILRDGEVMTSGASEPVALACRLVVTTGGDPRADARDGRMRDDLLRRFQQCIIRIPALRQRPSDLAVIIDRLVARSDAPGRTFTQPALTVLAALPWPGNIDELSATLDRMVPASGAVVRQEDVLARLPIEHAFTRLETTASLRDARRQFEREYIAAVLERHQWKMSEAARTLGIERANLYRKTRQLGISRAPRAEAS